MDDNIKYWLALTRIPGLGTTGQNKLLNLFESPEQIFQQNRQDLENLGLPDISINYIVQPDWNVLESDIKWLGESQHHLITCNDKVFPYMLKQVSDAPVVLFVNGRPEYLQAPQFGIVGSRNPDYGGKQIARKFSSLLIQLGFTITSGLALGIDKEAHLGALGANGKTIAVLGNGLDVYYPKRHRELAEKIAAEGALVSEFPTGVKPLACNFPRRNRIISGMSSGILVVEATLRSGSLITARYALEQNREVFAIPGPINNPLFKGCHELIKGGAKLVENIQDIIDELGGVIGNDYPDISGTFDNIDHNRNQDKSFEKILDQLTYGPVTVDNIVEHTTLTAEEVSSMLLILELKGLITCDTCGYYSRLN